MFILLFVLLYFPPIQKWVVKKAISYASEQTGLEISLDHVSLSFPLDLKLERFTMLRPNDSIPQRRDTVADVKELIVDVQLLPLLKSKVEVDQLTFKGLKANTMNYIGDLQIRGNLERLHVVSHGIDLKNSMALLNQADIQGGFLDIALSDTMPKDTSKEKTIWKINIDKLSLYRTAFRLRMPGDTMVVGANFAKATVGGTAIDLYNNVYRVRQIDWQGGSLAYDKTYEPKMRSGFDAAHMALGKINIGIDSLAYSDEGISANIRAANFVERSGLTVRDMRTRFKLDSMRLYLQPLYLRMPESEIHSDIVMDLNAFADEKPGKIAVTVKGFVRKDDLQPLLLASVPTNILRAIPTKRINVDGTLQGNMKALAMRKLHIGMPQYFYMNANGRIANLQSTGNMRANLAISGNLEDIRFAKQLLPKSVAHTIDIPKSISFNAKIKARGTQYDADMLLYEGGGNVAVKGSYNTSSGTYNVTARAINLQLQHFMPKSGLHPFTGTISVYGKGTDVLNPKSSLRLKAGIGQFRFGTYVFDGIGADIAMSGGTTTAHIVSTNRMLGGDFTYRGKLTDKMADGHLHGWLRRVDLKQLGAMKETYVVSTWVDIDVRSNMKNNHYVSGPLRQLVLTNEGRHGTQRLAAGDLDITASVSGVKTNAHVKGNLAYANLKGLGLMDKNYILGTQANIAFRSERANHYTLEGYLGNLKLNEQRGEKDISLFDGDLNIHANMSGKRLNGSANGLVRHTDIYQLGIVDKPFVSNFATNIEFDTDMADQLKVRGMLGNLQVQTANERFTPGDVTIDILSRADTTHAVIEGGDFVLNTDWQGSYQHVLKAGQNIANNLNKQIENKRIDQMAIQALLPVGRLKLVSGEGNLFSKLLAQQGYVFKTADIDLSSSPAKGLNGNIFVDSLVYNDLRVDTLIMDLTTNDTGLNYSVQILNKADNNYPYKGFVYGSLFERGMNTSLAVTDMNDKTALALSAQAAMQEQGINLSLTSAKAILGYKNFNVNENNYLYIGRNRRLSAEMQLLADDGAGLHLYTDDADSTALQNFTVSVNKFELSQLMNVLPFAPRISGELNGDYHVVQTATDLTVSSDMGIKNMMYELNSMGNVGAQFVYIPKNDGSHYIDAILSKDEMEIGKLSGTYDSRGKGSLEAEFTMDKFPLNYINGFIPDRIVGLRGTGEGTLTMQGPLNKLDINGEVYLDSSHVFSEPYGVEMRFANDPVLIKNSRVEFENFEVFANNNAPLNIIGYLDFSDFDRMSTDLRMRARNFQIISAKENLRSEVYRKAFVDFDGRMKGLLSSLRLEGKMDVLGSTDLTYVMRDAQLATDNELENLVTFTNLNDSTVDVVKRPDIQGFSMNVGIGIDNQAHIVCALNPERSNYIDLIGGGSFTMQYDPTNGTRLRGRYTMNSGQMKYSLPIIPLRTFQIHEDSYIEFTGNPAEPTLSITATERVRTNVSDGSGSGRLVDFDAGVRLSKRFPNPGIEFIIQAPEDQEMQGKLNTKSVEERSKLAVTMLASGMYFDGSNGSTANAAMNSALMGFFQNQVNAITGRALNSMGVDITANMESAADASGSLHTDYTFKFSKRLWDNRLRIIMGGRVSTGSQMSEQNGAFFDNFSLEYRLNKKETQYLKLYYEREAYDWLEGNQGEFGVGFMWRRKLQHFKDIFRFKGNKEQAQERDSLIKFVNEKKQ
ncbi:translocation/assembly module TamB domain-containing protein [Prevotella falsenii]|uniref:translocation/assembly module TamB domain-containing protein n=1 Tax=Prevotella falsenii TaxID=515414 RepID=UPI00278C44C4|nr:translocation/assembly module TamB domain-containing protein [Prevotella falsenii]